MKKYLLCLMAIGLLLVSCKKDEEPTLTDLNYDGDNQSAPFLPIGEHEMAARFPASFTSDFSGKKLKEIRFYLVNLPTECEIRVYGPKSTTEPGDLLYSADVTSGIGPNGWNIHPVTSTVEITGQDLWIALRVVHSSETNTVGCDFGPAKNDGDWIFSNTSTTWESFRQRTNGDVSINWNIRGIVE